MTITDLVDFAETEGTDDYLGPDEFQTQSDPASTAQGSVADGGFDFGTADDFIFL